MSDLDDNDNNCDDGIGPMFDATPVTSDNESMIDWTVDTNLPEEDAFFSEDSDREDQFCQSRSVTFERSRSVNLETRQNLPTASHSLIGKDVSGSDNVSVTASERTHPLHTASRSVLGQDWSSTSNNLPSTAPTASEMTQHQHIASPLLFYQYLCASDSFTPTASEFRSDSGSGDEFKVHLHCGDMLYPFHTSVLFSSQNEIENEVFIHGDFGEQYFPNINDVTTSIENNSLIAIGDNSSTVNNRSRERHDTEYATNSALSTV